MFWIAIVASSEFTNHLVVKSPEQAQKKFVK